MFFKCIKIKAMLADLSALSPEASAEFKSHASECADCSLEYIKAQKLRDALTNAAPYSAPAYFTSKVMARIDNADRIVHAQMQTTRSPFERLVRHSIAATIVLAIGLSIIGGYYATAKTDPLDNAILSAFNTSPIDAVDI